MVASALVGAPVRPGGAAGLAVLLLVVTLAALAAATAAAFAWRRGLTLRRHHAARGPFYLAALPTPLAAPGRHRQRRPMWAVRATAWPNPLARVGPTPPLFPLPPGSVVPGVAAASDVLPGSSAPPDPDDASRPASDLTAAGVTADALFPVLDSVPAGITPRPTDPLAGTALAIPAGADAAQLPPALASATVPWPRRPVDAVPPPPEPSSPSPGHRPTGAHAYRGAEGAAGHDSWIPRARAGLPTPVQLACLDRARGDLAAVVDRMALARVACDATADLVDADHATLIVTTPEGPRNAADSPPGFTDLVSWRQLLDLVPAPGGHVAPRPWRTNIALRCLVHSAAVTADAATALVGVPVLLSGRPVGALLARRAGASPFLARDEDALLHLAGIVATDLARLAAASTVPERGVGTRGELLTDLRAALVAAVLPGWPVTLAMLSLPSGAADPVPVAALRDALRTGDGLYRWSATELALLLPSVRPGDEPAVVARAVAAVRDAMPDPTGIRAGWAVGTSMSPVKLVREARRQLRSAREVPTRRLTTAPLPAMFSPPEAGSAPSSSRALPSSAPFASAAAPVPPAPATSPAPPRIRRDDPMPVVREAATPTGR